MTLYPNNIKRLDAATFKEETENVAVQPADMDGGYVITRPRFTRRARRTFSFRYVEMRDADKLKLETMWATVKGGSNLFTWQHPISGELITVRFGPDMKLGFQRIGFAKLNVWESDTVTLVEV